MLPATTQRVSAHSSEAVNLRILHQTRMRIAWYERHPQQIDTRLRELDEEWDIERMLEANAASLAFTGSVLALTHNARWAFLSAGVAAFLFQHALQGWCPPLPVLRRLGFRTEREINIERMALKALRGDFGKLTAAPDDTRSAHAMTSALS